VTTRYGHGYARDQRRMLTCAPCRAHAHWIVTEYGAINVYGKALRERARLLISVAHPDDRAKLYDAASKRFGPSFKYMA
jgi:acyl-CoA hydrolase